MTYDNPAPVHGDTDFVLLTKISQQYGNVNHVNETEITLLEKICQSVSDQNGGANPPRDNDSKNDLLFKIAKSMSDAL